MRVIRCDLCKKEITENWGVVTLQTAHKPVDGALWIHPLDVVGNAVTKAAGCKDIIPIESEGE